MKQDFCFLSLENVPIFEQLKIEEACLRADPRNFCILNSGSPPAIVMGISEKLEKRVDLKKIKKNPIDLIRRFSGGGTVVVDENTLFVTFICNEEDIGVLSQPQEILSWMKAFFSSFFPKNSFQVIENDYVLENKKFGGNAQFIAKKRWLHHSTLLWNYSKNHMDYLLHPDKEPKYRHKRSHDNFLCSIQNIFPEKKQFLSLCEKKWMEITSAFHLPLEKVTNILERPHRKANQVVVRAVSD